MYNHKNIKCDLHIVGISPRRVVLFDAPVDEKIYINIFKLCRNCSCTAAPNDQRYKKLCNDTVKSS